VVTHQYVNPLVAIVLGAALLGEDLSLVTGVGAALIVGSVFVVVRGESTERKRAEEVAETAVSASGAPGTPASRSA
jgi:drug/metabolite transporter (DMT)-like permease